MSQSTPGQRTRFAAPGSGPSATRAGRRRLEFSWLSGFQWNWAWPRVLAPLAGAALVMLIALPIILHTSTEDRLTQEIVSGHVRSLMANHLTDIASSDQHTVKPWFNGKLPFSPPVTDLAAQGFPLIGGRLDYVEDHPVAALVYQRHKHFVNLFTWPSSRTSSTSGELRTRQGYNVIHWRQGGMEYWAVSDVGQDDLRDFVQLVREGAAPPSPH